MKKFFAFTNYALLAAMLCVMPFFIFHDTEYYLHLFSDKGELKILTMWHVETFEGGTVSRLARLKSWCAEYEKSKPTIKVFIRSIPAEQVLPLLQSNDRPDMISFAHGAQRDLHQYLLELNSEYGLRETRVDSGRVYGQLLAVPYQSSALVWVTDTIMSAAQIMSAPAIWAGNTNTIVTEYLSNYTGRVNDAVPMSGYEAYVGFKSERRPLLASLRDVARLLSGTRTYHYLPTELSLVQYMGVLPTSNTPQSLELLRHIMAPPTQSTMHTMGLLSPLSDIYTTGIYDIVESTINEVKYKKLW